MTKWHPLYSNGMVCLSVSYGKQPDPLSYLIECEGHPGFIIPVSGNGLDHIKASALHATVLAPL